jgi:hypothetical protein
MLEEEETKVKKIQQGSTICTSAVKVNSRLAVNHMY